MPSKSTNLHKQNAPGPKPDKRKREAVAEDVRPAKVQKAKKEESSKPVAVVQEEKAEVEAEDNEDEGEDDDEESENEDEEVETGEKAEGEENAEGEEAVQVEPLPTKEEIEADKDLSEGARLGQSILDTPLTPSYREPRADHPSPPLPLSFPLLALLYATLYLRFNPSPKYSPPTNPGTKKTKSMKASGPLPLDPYNEQQNFFQSDFTPADPTFELTEKQWAAKKKAARVGSAKKGDGKTGERWKFSKPREAWLMRHVTDEKHVSRLPLDRIGAEIM
jgi:hypothetical protein